jgi:hypothetical protein
MIRLITLEDKQSLENGSNASNSLIHNALKNEVYEILSKYEKFRRRLNK